MAGVCQMKARRGLIPVSPRSPQKLTRSYTASFYLWSITSPAPFVSVGNYSRRLQATAGDKKEAVRRCSAMSGGFSMRGASRHHSSPQAPSPSFYVCYGSYLFGFSPCKPQREGGAMCLGWLSITNNTRRPLTDEDFMSAPKHCLA